MIGRSSSLSFSERKPSLKGIFSVALSGLALVICVAAVFISYKNKGNAGTMAGSCGIMGFLSAVMGLGFGIGGLLESNRKKLPSLIGTIVGAVIVCGLAVLFIKGF